jgi:hypothetical protein
LPVNHSTPVMNITMDQDSISSRVRCGAARTGAIEQHDGDRERAEQAQHRP